MPFALFKPWNKRNPAETKSCIPPSQPNRSPVLLSLPPAQTSSQSWWRQSAPDQFPEKGKAVSGGAAPGSSLPRCKVPAARWWTLTPSPFSHLFRQTTSTSSPKSGGLEAHPPHTSAGRHHHPLVPEAA